MSEKLKINTVELGELIFDFDKMRVMLLKYDSARILHLISRYAGINTYRFRSDGVEYRLIGGKLYKEEWVVMDVIE